VDNSGQDIRGGASRGGNTVAGLGGFGVFVLVLFVVWMMIRGRG
jgi:hypothetical protein